VTPLHAPVTATQTSSCCTEQRGLSSKGAGEGARDCVEMRCAAQCHMRHVAARRITACNRRTHQRIQPRSIVSCLAGERLNTSQIYLNHRALELTVVCVFECLATLNHLWWNEFEALPGRRAGESRAGALCNLQGATFMLGWSQASSRRSDTATSMFFTFPCARAYPTLRNFAKYN
jgi:hypothetical protein